jgi:uncharacterized membrane protein YdjX (TVP38/TMEM64 family)
MVLQETLSSLATSFFVRYPSFSFATLFIAKKTSMEAMQQITQRKEANPLIHMMFLVIHWMLF